MTEPALPRARRSARAFSSPARRWRRVRGSAAGYAAAMLVACGSSPATSPRTCQTDADCASDAHCHGGGCVADLAPEARVTGPRSALTHVELSFDGSGSTDADDDIVSYSWSVRATGPTDCPPDLGVTGERSFRPLFPCAGEFEVALVVRDRAGVESQPAILPVSITGQAWIAPTLLAGADLALPHRCDGSPLTCSPVSPEGGREVHLQVRARDQFGGDAVTYRWDWIPPPGVVTATAPPVTFVSGQDGATPVVTITTPGTALAGRWSFVVTVTDANGLSARATQVVVIQNQPPVVGGGQPLTVSHSYDPATARYRAGGAVSVSYDDPDGDPITPGWRFHESAATHCTFGAGSGGPGTFDLSCADPAELIGQVERELELQVTDANGAVASSSWPLQVANQPPVLAPAPATVAFDHRVDDYLAPSYFVVQGSYAFVAVDPDGDPLPAPTLTPGADATRAPHSTARLVPDATGRPTFVFSTPIAFPLEFRAADGASAFTVRAEVSDPWSAAAPVSFAVAIGDRAPSSVGPIPPLTTLDHQYDGTAYVASGPIAALADPDGDPLVIADAGSTGPCTGLSLAPAAMSDTASVSCRLAYQASAGGVPPLASLTAPQTVAFKVSDPWGASLSSTSTLQITNHPPVAAMRAPASVPVACVQDASGTSHDPVSFDVSATFSDPDGDPVHLGWALDPHTAGSSVGGFVQPILATCADDSGTCGNATVVLDGSRSFDPLDLRVGVSDGDAFAVPTATVGLTCAN